MATRDRGSLALDASAGWGGRQGARGVRPADRFVVVDL